METSKLFETATRKKYRFSSGRGELSVEQLWDLNFEALDSLYKQFRSELKKNDEESLLETSKVNTETSEKAELVKYIFEARKAENAALKATRTAAALKAQQDEVVRELIAQKKGENLAGKSLEELEAMLNG